jgi:hypothetical protein
MSLVLFIGYLVSHQTLRLVSSPYPNVYSVEVQWTPIGVVINDKFSPRDYHFESIYTLNSVAPVKENAANHGIILGK